VSAIIGHDDLLRELRTLAASADPPHALLFAGPESTGRRLLALEYARLLNCERRPGAPTPQGSFLSEPNPPLAPDARPCGECRPCRHIAEGNHPDVIILGPGDMLCRPRPGDSSHPAHPQSRDIRICQVRGVIDLVSRFPVEANYRMIVVDPADRFAREAAHTVLKTLEEPPGHTAFALISAAPESIRETILSRCRRLDVRTVPRAVIEAGLVERGVDPEAAAVAAEAARGRPGRAIAFAARPDLMGDRGRLLEKCARVAQSRAVERIRYAEELTDRWRRDRALVTPELDAWESFWEGRLRAAAPGGPGPALAATLAALRAVSTARTDLQANVLTRAAFELMLLSFPRLTLDAPPQEEPALHA
jgi:DNA polymerase-3 subunit delta'